MPDTRPPVALKSVSVIIPTFRRPEGLDRAMASITAQTGLSGTALDLIVCDNSPEGSARPQVEAFALTATFPVLFVHEPKTGVANARNSAVATTQADFIAFLDDDEEAPADWLWRMLANQTHFKADVVFGPVTARIPDDVAQYRPYFEAFFSRFGPEESGVLPHYYGCGNSLIRRAVLPKDELPFATSQNEMGGEDDILFTALKAQGKVMSWAADAPVWEDVPPKRATLDYTLKRGFAYGQGPSHSTGVNGKYLKCAAWMMQGLIQAAVFGVMAGAAFATKSPKAAYLIDKAARGLGKTLWFPPFKMKFYGQALLKPAKRKG
ncbi:glycosyltransferase family 2 protein [Asticcacaulis sp. AC402]|uniref:glycosyltransferase family 2 protein n=1 Tax=Asticcacaulis sp. AC402 TaxID=1282361 RepID=UPI0003C3D42D|nr:glycosyltransferase family 2 protein [Asticcacaulis sp. AC402]ESQ77198.1 hypothetical protein ABAC402_02000 [Asticcacaulis sp. AC402]